MYLKKKKKKKPQDFVSIQPVMDNTFFWGKTSLVSSNVS